MPAPYALPAAFAALFVLGTVAAALNGRLPGTGVLIAAAVVVGITALVTEPLAAVPLAAVGWLMVTGFSRPPYADLRPTGRAAADAAIVIGATALGSAAAGTLFRWPARRFTLEGVKHRRRQEQAGSRGRARSRGDRPDGDRPGRRRAGRDLR